MKRVLVTGSSGFIGQHLVKRLLAEGHYVVGMDLIPHPPAIANPNFHFIQSRIADLENRLIFDWDFKPIDLVINLACPTIPTICISYPIETYKACTEDFEKVLTFAKTMGASVIQVSTIRVHDSNIKPMDGIAPYVFGKRMSEVIAAAWVREYKMDIQIVRPYSTYGPGMHPDDSRVIPGFINKALSGFPLMIVNDYAIDVFSYIDDTIDDIMRVVNGYRTQYPINIGIGDVVQIKKLAEMIVRLTGTETKIVDMKQDFQRHWLLDTEPQFSEDMLKAGRSFTPLEEGLAATVAWFKERA